jgi:hypothetical protein
MIFPRRSARPGAIPLFSDNRQLRRYRCIAAALLTNGGVYEYDPRTQ